MELLPSECWTVREVPKPPAHFPLNVRVGDGDASGHTWGVGSLVRLGQGSSQTKRGDDSLPIMLQGFNELGPLVKAK